MLENIKHEDVVFGETVVVINHQGYTIIGCMESDDEFLLKHNITGKVETLFIDEIYVVPGKGPYKTSYLGMTDDVWNKTGKQIFSGLVIEEPDGSLYI
jgi:hypothetical protein